MAMPSVIEAIGLNKSYGSKKALDGFDLAVQQGSIFGLLGPNGAGKTTAIEIMLGLRESDSGKVTVLGENPEKNYQKISSNIGAMLQQGGINPGLKPKEALKLYSAFYPQSRNVDELLELCDLKGINTPYRRLSGGQAQSLSLAVAIVGKPSLVFLDEPTVGMDPRARRRTWEIIKDLKNSGATVVLTTHLMDEAELLCDEIGIVSKGKIIAKGKPSELTKTKRDIVEVEFQKKVDSKKFGALLGIECEKDSEKSLRIMTEPNTDLLSRISSFAVENSNPVVRYASLSKTLEDVFIELTEGDSDE